MALGPTQPPTEMSTRNFFWSVKRDRCIWLTTLPSSCADCLGIFEPKFPGTLRDVQGSLCLYFVLKALKERDEWVVVFKKIIVRRDRETVFILEQKLWIVCIILLEVRGNKNL